MRLLRCQMQQRNTTAAGVRVSASGKQGFNLVDHCLGYARRSLAATRVGKEFRQTGLGADFRGHRPYDAIRVAVPVGLGKYCDSDGFDAEGAPAMNCQRLPGKKP